MSYLTVGNYREVQTRVVQTGNDRITIDSNGVLNVDNVPIIGDVAFNGNEISVPSGNIEFASDIDMGLSKITNVAEPTSDFDAATKIYVDEKSNLVDTIGGEVISTETGHVRFPIPDLATLFGQNVQILDSTAVFWDVAYGPTVLRFCAIAQDARIWYSDDGQEWFPGTQPRDSSATIAYFVMFVPENQRFAIGTNKGLWFSSNGKEFRATDENDPIFGFTVNRVNDLFLKLTSTGEIRGSRCAFEWFPIASTTAGATNISSNSLAFATNNHIYDSIDYSIIKTFATPYDFIKWSSIYQLFFAARGDEIYAVSQRGETQEQVATLPTITTNGTGEIVNMTEIGEYNLLIFSAGGSLYYTTYDLINFNEGPIAIAGNSRAITWASEFGVLLAGADTDASATNNLSFAFMPIRRDGILMAGGRRITGLPYPEYPSDAATREFVLTRISAVDFGGFYFIGNGTATVIGGNITDFFQVVGSGVEVSCFRNFRFNPLNNTVRMTRPQTRTFIITITATVNSGNNNNVQIAIAVSRSSFSNPHATPPALAPNTDIIQQSISGVTTNNDRPVAVTCQTIDNINLNDRIYAVVRNTSGADITARNLSILIRSLN